MTNSVANNQDAKRRYFNEEGRDIDSEEHDIKRFLYEALLPIGEFFELIEGLDCQTSRAAYTGKILYRHAKNKLDMLGKMLSESVGEIKVDCEIESEEERVVGIFIEPVAKGSDKNGRQG